MADLTLSVRDYVKARKEMIDLYHTLLLYYWYILHFKIYISFIHKYNTLYIYIIVPGYKQSIYT